MAWLNAPGPSSFRQNHLDNFLTWEGMGWLYQKVTGKLMKIFGQPGWQWWGSDQEMVDLLSDAVGTTGAIIWDGDEFAEVRTFCASGGNLKSVGGLVQRIFDGTSPFRQDSFTRILDKVRVLSWTKH